MTPSTDPTPASAKVFAVVAVVLIGVPMLATVNAHADMPPPSTARPSAYPTYPKPSPTDPSSTPSVGAIPTSRAVPGPSASPTESKFQPPNLNSPPPSSSPVAPTTRTTPRPTTAQPQTTPSLPASTSPSSPAPTTSAPSPTSTPMATSGTTLTVHRTGYGWADNDCGGGGGDCLAYPPYHAGGDGTYDNPTSAAARKGDYPIGTLVYFADLGYFKIMDTCGGCKPGGIDVWVDGRGLADDGRACMGRLTGWDEATINPGPNLPVTRDFPLCGGAA